MGKSVLITAVVAAIGLSWPVAAQVAVSDSVRALDEVAVVAAKVNPVLLPLEVTTIGEDEIVRSAETNVLPVVMTRVPGMFVTERGLGGYGVSGDAAGTVNIRGVGQGNKVLFMIDGQPQWAGVFGHALPDTYVTNDIERVEVVSGPSSMLYGSGAMGGSVNLITRHGRREGFGGMLRAMGGSHATQKYDLRGSWGHNGLSVAAGANYDATHGHRKGMKYWLSNQFASLGYEFSSHWKTAVNAMLTETRAENPGSVYAEMPLDMWTRMLRSTVSLSVNDSYRFGSGGLQAYWNYGRHKIDDGVSNGLPRDYLFNSSDYNMGVTAYQTVRPWEGNRLSGGVDFKHYGGEAWNTMKADGERQPIQRAHVNEIAGYLMTQQSLIGNVLAVNGGARLEHSSQYGNQWVPQAGFIVRPDLLTGRGSESTVKFSYGKGFRSPTIRELYMYPPHNPDLRPERLDNFEISWRGGFADGRVSVGAAVYYINGDNMIQTVRIDGSPRNVNTGSFINKGFEADATWAIDRRWTVTANYAYLHTSTRIVAAPRNKIYAEVRYADHGLDVSVDCMVISRLMTEQSTENYTLINARAAYTLPWAIFSLRSPLTVFVKGENLTNRHYQINYGFPMPGATLFAGLSLPL